ncbi:MAG: DUF4113 domain-containing protein, partial [Elusimicrobia bacterium]|nr:DUF4113 domain-containing protein [Elusimicrobiota bacterium]
DDGRAERSRRLLKTMDLVNASLGPGTLSYGGALVSRETASRSERRSPRWTTVWDELPTAKA